MSKTSSLVASSERIVRSKPAAIRAMDWAAAIAGLVVGLYLVATGWPNPGFWSWAILALGVAGVPLAIFNPMGKIQGLLLRALIKRKR